MLTVLSCAMGLTRVLWAQEAPPTVLPDQTVFGLTPGQWILFMSNVGFAGVFLYFLLQSLKRQEGLDTIVKRYDETQKAHLEAFKDITANYRQLTTDMRDAMLLSVQVQTRLVEKLDQMERTHGK